jgi:hypothetical protein
MPENIPSRPLLQWQTLDAYPHQRSVLWYLIGGLCVLAFALYGIFDGSWTTTILALLIGMMYLLLHNTEARTIVVEVSGFGIKVGQELIPWNLTRDFWILLPQSRQGPLPPELHIALTNRFRQELVLFLSGIDPALVRQTLLKFIPERSGMEERVLDMLIRLLKL